MRKSAVITGITGQDGSYLAELLISKGYEVHGIVKRESIEDDSRLKNIKHIIKDIKLHVGSLSDTLFIYKVFKEAKPDECYHLAAASYVDYTFSSSIEVMSINFFSTLNLLTTIEEVSPECRFFFAGSSEMFGDADVCPQNEETQFNPRSIYGISKVASHLLVKKYRRRGIFACTGILYNHESPRRGNQFVTKKIVRGAVRIKFGLERKLILGNIHAKRDWGYAPEYVQAMYLMLNAERPDDYVIATGKLHSVQDFLSMTFGYLGLSWEDFVEIDPKLVRDTEKVPLCGDPSKIKRELGWQSKKELKDIIKEMVDAEIQELQSAKLL